MSITLQSVVIRHERRIRLLFTNSLAAGAFGAAALAFYSVVNEDGTGADATVVGAYPVPNTPHAVELALGIDLVDTGLYQITALGVPAVDATVTGADATTLARIGLGTPVQNVEPAATVVDRDALLYGVDLQHDGDDFLEDASNDLATVGGLQNAMQAVVRRETGEPLDWAPDYSPRARSYVDGPSPSLDDLRAELLRQATLDPRIKSATAVVSSPISSDNSDTVVKLTLTPIGTRTPQTVSFPLPT